MGACSECCTKGAQGVRLHTHADMNGILLLYMQAGSLATFGAAAAAATSLLALLA